MTNLFLWASVVIIVVALSSWLVFGRLCMARIERELKTEGIRRPCPWDGPGARIVWYAWAIAIPVGRFNKLDDPFIDVPLVRERATRQDKVIATVMLASTAAMMTLIFFG